MMATAHKYAIFMTRFFHSAPSFPRVYVFYIKIPSALFAQIQWRGAQQ